MIIKWTYKFTENNYRVATYIVPNYYRIHHSKFEIDRTILTCLKFQKFYNNIFLIVDLTT